MQATALSTISHTEPVLEVTKKPIFPWAGSKFNQPNVIELLKNEWCKVEPLVLVVPFCGALGDVMALHRAGITPIQVFASDLSPEVVGFYRWVQNGGKWNWEILCDHNNPTSYTYYRSMFNLDRFLRLNAQQELDDDTYYTLFFRLLKTCVNGLWRVSGKTGFNVPIGRNSSKIPKQVTKVPDLAFYREFFRRFTFSCKSFEDLLVIENNSPNHIPENAFIYCDPPYLNTFQGYTSIRPEDVLSNQNNNKKYQGSKSSKFPTRQLFDMAVKWNKAGHTVAISNSGICQNLFDEFGFSTVSVLERRSINCTGNRDRASELFGVLR